MSHQSEVVAGRYSADQSDHGVPIVLDSCLGGWSRIVCGCQTDAIAEDIARSLNNDDQAVVSLTEADRRFIGRVLLRHTAGPDRRYAKSIVAKLESKP